MQEPPKDLTHNRRCFDSTQHDTHNPLTLFRCYHYPMLPNFKRFSNTSILIACAWVAVFVLYAWFAYAPEANLKKAKEKLKG